MARQGGASPVVVEVESPDLDAASLRYRVFPNADASVVFDQPFSVKVGFFGVAPP